MKTVYTFNWFWDKYHRKNPRLKLNKSNTERLWNNINCIGKKFDLIMNIEKTKLSCYEYLKLKL